MIEKELAEMFLEMNVSFCWKLNGKETISSGYLKTVSDNAIVIEFYNRPQVYSLECLIWLRERDNMERRG